MEQRVIDVVENCRPKSGGSISLKTDIQNDLEFESLDMIMLGNELEEEFGVIIRDEDLKGVRTVSDIIGKIENLLKNGEICYETV
ncbi:MAG: phosphopantetheine-binding protein [Synergistaceae bacterium]|nr:phosphopantetheine-binding protein [Synergistaceae bacterium]